MKSIGISVTPSEVFIAIGEFKSTRLQIINTERIRVPFALPVSDRLRYLRTLLLDIIKLRHIELACVRIAGRNMPQTTVQRIEIEGTVQELLSSSSIKHYFVGELSEIAAMADILPDLNSYLVGRKDFVRIKDWPHKSRREEKEALLAAYAVQYSYELSKIF